MREDEQRQDDSLLRAAPTFARFAVTAWIRSLRWGLDTVQTALGIADERPEPAMGEEAEPARRDDSSAKALRERGAELLRLSADVTYEEDSHPAYARILDVMAPDEARILRMLMEQGSQ